MKTENPVQIKSTPTAFCYNPSQVRAIVLGADPSNFSDNGERKILTKVFGIGDGDPRYFQGILKNLKEVGLGLEDIYVDNLIQDYLDVQTSKNKEWYAIAEENIPFCLTRLDAIDKKRIIPVLITAEVILKNLLNNKSILKRPMDYYSDTRFIPIKPEDNKLFRNLIPFYRHQKYTLSQHNQYKAQLINILGVR